MNPLLMKNIFESSFKLEDYAALLNQLLISSYSTAAFENTPSGPNIKTFTPYILQQDIPEKLEITETKIEYQDEDSKTGNLAQTKRDKDDFIESPEESKQDDALLSARESNNELTQKSLVKTLQFETDYGRAVLDQLIGQDKAFITFYPSFAAQDEIRSAEIEEMATNFAKDGKVDKRAAIKSSQLKNFCKMMGDQFVNFAAFKYKTQSLKKIFKDKSSCAKLSEYLDGTCAADGLSVKAFIQMYFDFIEEMNINDIENSKITSKSLRTCYKLIYNYMKAIIQALRNWEIMEKVHFVQIEKFWPTVELSIKWK